MLHALLWQTEGRVTHFVASTGTCGTLTGTGAFLKSMNGAVKVRAWALLNCPVLYRRRRSDRAPLPLASTCSLCVRQVVAAVPIEGHDIPGA